MAAQPFGFDFARAFASGVNVIVENVAPYGYANFDRAPEQTLRLIETAHRCVEQHADRMALALTSDDIRTIVASGRLAVVQGTLAGFELLAFSMQVGEPGADAGAHRGGVGGVGGVGGELFQFEHLGVMGGLDPVDAGLQRGELGVPVGGGVSGGGGELFGEQFGAFGAEDAPVEEVPGELIQADLGGLDGAGMVRGGGVLAGVGG